MKRVFFIKWIDSGREPRVAPNPTYPNGIDLILAQPGQRTCDTDLPYPAKRCGRYEITCKTCAFRVGITTAGRPDDPRSVKLACPFGEGEPNMPPHTHWKAI